MLFQENGYPLSIIDSRIKRKMLWINTSKTIGPQKQAVYLKVPYMGTSSEKLIKSVRETVKDTFYSVQFRVVFQTQPLISINKKDVISSKSKSNIVYKFSCKHCDSVYIGKSYRRLGDRIAEHVPSFIRKAAAQKKTFPANFSTTEHIQAVISHYRLRSRPVVQPVNQFISSSSKSAIWMHLMENPACSDSYSESCFEVMVTGRNQFHVDVLEGVFINAERPILCQQKEFVYNVKLFKN